MAEKYLRDVTALMARLGPRLPWGCVLKLKHFFGGAAVYAGGNICITFTPAGLALKLPEEARDALTADGATPLRYFPKRRSRKNTSWCRGRSWPTSPG